MKPNDISQPFCPSLSWRLCCHRCLCCRCFRQCGCYYPIPSSFLALPSSYASVTSRCGGTSAAAGVQEVRSVLSRMHGDQDTSLRRSSSCQSVQACMLQELTWFMLNGCATTGTADAALALALAAASHAPMSCSCLLQGVPFDRYSQSLPRSVSGEFLWFTRFLMGCLRG